MLTILAISAGQIFKLGFINLGGIILLDILVFTLALYSVFKIKYRLLNPLKHYIFILLFILVMLLSLVFSPLHLTFNDLLISLFYPLRFILYFFVGLFYFSNHFNKNQIVSLFIYSGFVLSVLGILQIILLPSLSFLEPFGWDPHLFRVVSTFLDPNFLASFLVLTLLLLNLDENRINKKLRYVFFSIIFLSLVGTFSRSGMLMFFVSFLTLSVLSRSIKIFLLTIILTSTLYFSIQTYNNFFAIEHKIDRQASASLRFSSWETGIAIFEKYPLLGVGFNNYRYALKEFQLAPEGFINSRAGAGNDSSLIFVAATTGVFGLITYLLIYLNLLIIGLKETRKGNSFAIVLISGLFGLFVNSIFINSLFYPPILFWVFLNATCFSRYPHKL